jgi:hypothetical protein
MEGGELHTNRGEMESLRRLPRVVRVSVAVRLDVRQLPKCRYSTVRYSKMVVVVVVLLLLHRLDSASTASSSSTSGLISALLCTLCTRPSHPHSHSCNHSPQSCQPPDSQNDRMPLARPPQWHSTPRGSLSLSIPYRPYATQIPKRRGRPPAQQTRPKQVQATTKPRLETKTNGLLPTLKSVIGRRPGTVSFLTEIVSPKLCGTSRLCYL